MSSGAGFISQDLLRDEVRRATFELGVRAEPPVPQVRVYNSANIRIDFNATEQVLTFNSERFDVGEFHSTGTNPSRLTIPVAGLYALGAHVSFAGNATGQRKASLRVNGTAHIAISEVMNAGANFTQLPVSTLYRLAKGDYVEVVVMQWSGGALDVIGAGNYSPEFWAVRLGGFETDTFGA